MEKTFALNYGQEKTMNKIIKDLRSYALENYAKDGWDILVECYDDEDIMQDMDGATNLADAIKNVGKWCKLRDERRKEMESMIW
jgi:uncharacterized protein YfeS